MTDAARSRRDAGLSPLGEGFNDPPLDVLNGSHYAPCPVLTEPNPVPDDCICLG